MINDCIFTAFRDHARYLGVRIGLRERLFFHRYRFKFGVSPWEPTPLNMVVTSIARLAWRSLYRTRLIVRYEVYEPWEITMHPASKGIDIEPAIYCSLNTKHAYFSETLPKDDWICLAIQITRIQ